MYLNAYDNKQKQICANIESYLSVCSNLNMLCSLRNNLIESLNDVNKLIAEVDKETFKEHIKEYSVWSNKRKVSRILSQNWMLNKIRTRDNDSRFRSRPWRSRPLQNPKTQ